ncbi:MAG TPA: hypothetical protein VII25_01660 [Candidatus Acidoferrum sp.]
MNLRNGLQRPSNAYQTLRADTQRFQRVSLYPAIVLVPPCVEHAANRLKGRPKDLSFHI